MCFNANFMQNYGLETFEGFYSSSKGSFINYVEVILRIFDPLPLPIYKIKSGYLITPPPFILDNVIYEWPQNEGL